MSSDGLTAPASPLPSRRVWLAALAMAGSGFAGLAYQILWTQQAALALGHESAAVLAVVAAFFGGLAVGALALGRHLEHSGHPARWYAACELVIAAWCVVLAYGLPSASHALAALLGDDPTPVRHWFIAFAGTFALLLPATAAMGATLPAMERALAPWRRTRLSIGGLYAANTAGAIVGALLAALWLVPALGARRAALACAALNVLCAAIAWRAFGSASSRPSPPAAVRGSSWLLAVTGFLGIAYEVVVVRVLTQVAENTVYTFALLLAVYLLGTSVGAAVYQRLRDRGIAVADATGRWCWLLGSSCLFGIASLWFAPALARWPARVLAPDMGTALLGEALVATAAFLLPTVAMGALFSHLCSEASVAGRAFSRCLGLNTLGAALAPGLVGVWLAPALGAKATLLAIAASYLVLAALHAPPRRALAAAAVVALGLALTAPPLRFVTVPDGGRLVAWREGALGAVSIVEDRHGVATLHIDDREQEGSSHTVYADARQALLPLALHPAPHRALFLGLGTGVTASAAALDPGLAVDAVELIPEVIVAAAYFRARVALDVPADRLRVIPADARRYVRATSQRYDVVVADNFHPARSGSAALYTVEHFRAVRTVLAPDGVFCQWLPLHQLDLDTLRSIVRSFLAVYPDGRALLATHSLETPVLGLLGHRDARGFDLDAVRGRLAAEGTRDFAAYGLDGELAVLGSFVAGPRALRAFAQGAALNTDDRPIVATLAAHITYDPVSSPRQRLFALLGSLDLRAREVLQPVRDVRDSVRLEAYWHARDRFLAAGRSVQPTGDVQAMLRQVEQPLLDVLRISPDFAPAYEPLLQMAVALRAVDVAHACALLDTLVALRPARAEALAARGDCPATASRVSYRN